VVRIERDELCVSSLKNSQSPLSKLSCDSISPKNGTSTNGPVCQREIMPEQSFRGGPCGECRTYREILSTPCWKSTIGGGCYPRKSRWKVLASSPRSGVVEVAAAQIFDVRVSIDLGIVTPPTEDQNSVDARTRALVAHGVESVAPVKIIRAEAAVEDVVAAADGHSESSARVKLTWLVCSLRHARRRITN
jgi:hypothetical protein